MKKHRIITLITTLVLLLVSAQIVLADSSYTITAGDTLGRIAQSFGIGQQEIVNANGIANPDRIYVGQTLTIPDGVPATEPTELAPIIVERDEPAPAAPAPSTPAPQVLPANGGAYTVQRGDTLSQIAQRYGLSTAQLAAANGIGNASYIYAGQTLTIPGVTDTGQAAAVAPAAPANVVLPAGLSYSSERWIDVNLSTQTLVAYEGTTPVFTTLISSGLPQYATVVGEFRIWLRYESQDMNGYAIGYDYYTPDVPYVQYFYKGFAIHGAYWHNNFGTPMSHGCVNVTPADAAWLYNFATNGTWVKVHY